MIVLVLDQHPTLVDPNIPSSSSIDQPQFHGQTLPPVIIDPNDENPATNKNLVITHDVNECLKSIQSSPNLTAPKSIPVHFSLQNSNSIGQPQFPNNYPTPIRKPQATNKNFVISASFMNVDSSFILIKSLPKLSAPRGGLKDAPLVRQTKT